jgi:hypothetical protein
MEAVIFPEGRLVLISWVGTIVIGQPHTGCYSYSIANSALIALSDKHRRYLTLEQERKDLHTHLDMAELHGIYNTKVEAMYTRLYEISEAQTQLCQEDLHD